MDISPGLPIALLSEATQRLVRGVDGFHGPDWGVPSLLPGWTRSHVVAHLALNAEGLAAALTGVVQLEPAPMYVSQESRDTDIEELAVAESDELRERFLASTTQLDEALAKVPDDARSSRLERTPGGPTFSVGAVPLMRLREVEIHHADLLAGYTHHDWPQEFATLLVGSAARLEAWSKPFRASATDVGEVWECGGGGPTVTGTAADLGWWLTGRGDGEGLASDDGELPRIGAW